VLFISGDPDNVPFSAHRAALVEAIEPFRRPRHDDPSMTNDCAREQFGDLLTILKNPTLAEVMRECHETSYTHVHILTHGDETSSDSYGLVLRDEDGAPDVVIGERFASALTSIGRDAIRRPAVVTVASCDSANIGTVTIPGASFAHALHQAGIALVVASQFPLSMEGSLPLAGTLFQGLLWGEHPLVLLQRLRSELHARYTSTWHDWASLVVYEALPQALGGQLDALRYFQTKRAIEAALERIDDVIHAKHDAVSAGSPRELLETLDQAVERAVERLPLNGQYAVECLGLRASARKRLAYAAFALTAESPVKAADLRGRDTYDLLEQAYVDYDEAVRRLLVSDATTVYRVSTLHWVLVQAICLAAVLGRDDVEERWMAAKLSADLYTAHTDPEQRAWAHASLAELWLLKLSQRESSETQRQRFAACALEHVNRLVAAYPSRAEFPVTSTLRQFRRYIEWWGSSHFEQGLAERASSPRPSWDALIDTAQDLIRRLERRTARPASEPRPTPPPALRVERPKSQSPTSSAPPRIRNGPFFDIEMLPAGHGDALWIEYGDADVCHRWLIDCGTQQTAPNLLRRVEQIPKSERMLELFVMTHIDSDHIGGALPFLRAAREGLRFGDVWFNGWRHLSGRLGARQGEAFSTAIEDLRLPWNAWREGNAIAIDGETLPEHVLPGGMKLTLLSPAPRELKKLAPVWVQELKRYGLEPGSRVDYSRFLKGTPSTSTNVDELADAPFSGDAGAPNGTSIALLAEFGGAAAVLGADAYAPVLAASIKRLLQQRGIDRLKVDVFKLAHHGSQNNLNKDLLALLDCRHYLLSTNGDYFCHPDRQAIGRIVKYGGARPTLHFNYRTRYNDVWAQPDLQEKYSYAAHFPEADTQGLAVSLVAPRN
jgi:hypothetical protein